MRSLWLFFLIWTAVSFIVMPFEIGLTQIDHWITHSELNATAKFIYHIADALWITIAALIVYCEMARDEGLSSARRSALIICLLSGAVEAIGVLTCYPFGPYQYTQRFGLLLFGLIPYTIPLAWLIIVGAGRHLLWRLRPGWPHWAQALGVGFVAVLTDINLEFIAWRVRGYWFWYPGWFQTPSWPPLQNYISWFLLAALLAWLLPRPRLLSPLYPVPRKPIYILFLMNLLFLVVHLARYLRGV